MKFRAEHLEVIKSRIDKLEIDVKATLDHYTKNGIGNDPLARLSFDLFSVSKFSKDYREECREYNDKHIETAMKHIIKQLIND